MLRGLAVRQGVLAIHAVLGLVFLMLVFQMIRVGLRPSAAVIGPAAGGDAGSADSLKLAEVRSRDVYKAISNHRLFGAAGNFDPGSKPAAPPPPPQETTEETKLPLELHGTSLLEGFPERSAAIIELKNEGNKTKTFYPDEEILSNVFLKEVRPAAVVLDNRNDNRLELLQIDWAKAGSRSPRSASSRVATPIAAATVNRPNLITLDRAEISRKLEEEYARVASTLNVKIVTDADGNTTGITTDNIEQYGIAQELGFRNGDVLVSVNNEPVRSRDDAVNVVRKYQSASIFRIGVLRGGQMQYITYRVR